VINLNVKSRLGERQIFVARMLRDEWSTEWMSPTCSKEVMPGLIARGIAEPSDPRLMKKRRVDEEFIHWGKARRGPRWWDYAYQWARPACEGIGPETPWERERNKEKAISAFRGVISSIDAAILAEADALADGKNDPTDMYELARRRKDAAATYKSLTGGVAKTLTHAFVLYSDGIAIEVKSNANWTSKVLAEAEAIYETQHKRKPPSVEAFHRV